MLVLVLVLAQDLDLVLVLAQDLGTSACASSFGVWFVLKVLGVGKNARRHGAPRGSPPPTKIDMRASKPPDPLQNGRQLGLQKINFLRPKLGSILGGSWRARGVTEHFFGGPRATPKPPPKWRSLGILFSSVSSSGEPKK